jgi:uncharacterized protein YkwD
MLLAAMVALVLIAPLGANPAEPGSPASAKVVAADFHPDRPDQFPTWQAEAEQRLLDLTNADRKRNGLAPLQMDATLTSAARAHAAAMASKRELSHQLPGEAALGQRVASPGLHLTIAGENVALDVDIDQAHDALMHSPPHRANVLKADYNVVGLGVARVGDRIFVTEDFGRKLATLPVGQVEEMVAGLIAQSRNHVRGAQLHRLQVASLRTAACSMATQDRVNPNAIRGLGPMRYALTYTNMQADELPASAQGPLRDSRLRSFAVGACYAQSPSYPNGTYWIAVAFY